MIRAMDTSWEWLPVLLALGIALSMQPWRLLRDTELLNPFLGSLVITPWLWALPRLHTMPLQLQLTGSCMVLLMLGWPLAVPAFCLIAVLSAWIGHAPPQLIMENAFWLGILPATLAMLLGALIRRFIGTHLFVYILGRGFFGTVACVFASSVLHEWAGMSLPHVDPSLTTIAHWLIAWGDGFMTGMLTAIFVAFRPEWLATWSDGLYFHHPHDPPSA